MEVALNADEKNLKRKIGELIVSCLNSNEKLPTEREMVEQFGVSRTTLREVLSVYEACGMITSQQGSGRYVQMPNIGAQIVDTWSILLMADPMKLLELLEVRRILELHSLRQAMQGINVEQLQRLKIQVERMKEMVREGKTFAKYDREFHVILFSSTNNTLLEQLLTSFWDLYEASHVEAYHDQLVQQAEKHEEILNAFARGDLDCVRKLMEEQFIDARYRIVVALMEEDAIKSSS